MSACKVLVADPPWPFGDKLPGPGRGAEKHYSVLSIEQIKNFPLPTLADDALLFLWRVAAMVPEAYEVCKTWGFVAKSEIVWVKTTTNVTEVGVDGSGLAFGMGHYTRASHEVCIIARRGKAKVRDRSVRSLFFAPRGEHSRKPDEFYERVEALSEGPYVELFARRHRLGWDTRGDELDGAAQ